MGHRRRNLIRTACVAAIGVATGCIGVDEGNDGNDEETTDGSDSGNTGNSEDTEDGAEETSTGVVMVAPNSPPPQA